MVEYADWALGNFVSQAQKQDWFANTLFVFVADHGYAKPSSPYQMPLSYHHTPMFLYYPTEIAPHRDSSLALQIDLTPTILSMLFSDYQNHTLGVDLQRVERQYAYFCADDKVGVLDRDYFYICERQGGEFLYRLGDSTKHNHISDLQRKGRANETLRLFDDAKKQRYAQKLNHFLQVIEFLRHFVISFLPIIQQNGITKIFFLLVIRLSSHGNTITRRDNTITKPW